MLKVDALYDHFLDEGLQPEMVEDDEELTICCPMCGDDRPRLYVNAETGGWICFHCHESGNLHQLLMRGLELDGPTAFDLSRKFTTTSDEDFDYYETPQKQGVVKQEQALRLRMPPAYNLIGNDSPKLFLNYLLKRQVSLELAISRKIGYSVSGRYAYRVIVPVQTDGHLFTYVARTVLNQCPNCTERIDDCSCKPRKFPKVLTPTKAEGSQPSLTLFNFDAVRAAKPDEPVVVEGIYDALRLPTRAVALLGSSASATQLALIAGLARHKSVTLALDPDDAGYNGAIKIAEALTSEAIHVRIALLPEGEDVGSIDHVTLEECLRTARPFII